MDILKFKKTYKFAFYSSFLLAFLSFLLLIIVLQFFNEVHLSYTFIFVFNVLLFVFSFLIIQYRVEKFIYKRIQKIYREVSVLDMDDFDKNTITSDMETLSKNVKKFVDDKHIEIETLKEREKYRREFLGNISHELKTPLFTVQGYILTLLEGAMNDKNIREKYLERANNGVERLNHIVKDLDMISKLETGDLQLNVQNFNILLLIDTVFELLEMEASKRNISLHFDKVYETPLFVVADKNRIQQVLINLIANAIYYGSSNGHVILSVRYFSETQLVVTVTDDGDGIPKNKLPRLFERFYRVEKSRARNQGGTGLGLSIVKHIIEAHNQQVFVESEVGKGSVFSFTLSVGRV